MDIKIDNEKSSVKKTNRKKLLTAELAKTKPSQTQELRKVLGAGGRFNSSGPNAFG